MFESRIALGSTWTTELASRWFEWCRNEENEGGGWFTSWIVRSELIKLAEL